MAAAGPRRALIGPARSRGRFERQRPARRRLPVRHDAAPVLAEDGAEPPHAGGAEERGDVQRAPGELRQLDEHQPAGGDLHIAGRGQVLEDARVLHPRQHHQVPADPRRDHRHGQGGGGVQGPRPRGHAAAEAAEGPWGRRSRARCVWGPWPRNSRQWKRPAGEEAGQAISQAVRAGTLWLLSPQGCPQTLPVPPLRQNQSPNRAPPLYKEFSLLVASKSLEIFLKIRSWLRSEVLPSPESEFFSLTRFNLKYSPVQRYQYEGKHFLDRLDCYFFKYLKLGKVCFVCNRCVLV